MDIEQLHVLAKIDPLEEFHGLVFQKIPEGIWVTNTDGSIQYINPSGAALIGYAPEELIGRHWESLMFSARGDIVAATDGKPGLGLSDHHEYMLIHRNGEHIPVMITKSALVEEDRFIGTVAVLTDIRERKRAEEELKEKDRLIESVIQSSAVATFVIDAQHKVVYWNQACEELTGMKAQDLIGTSDHWKAFYDYYRPCVVDIIVDNKSSDMPDLYSTYSKSLLIEGSLCAEGWYPNIGGKNRYITFDAAPIFGAHNELIAAIETIQDITERKRLETQIEKAKKEWEVTFDAISDMIILTDSNRRIIRCNAATIHHLQTTYKDLLGKCLDEVFLGADAHATAYPLRETEKVQFPTLSGWYKIATYAIQNDNRRTVWLIEEITHRIEAEQALLESESRFRSLFEHSNDAVFLYSFDGHILDANTKACDLLGYQKKELLTMRFQSLYDRDKIQTFQEAYERIWGKGEIRLDARLQRANGTLVDVEINFRIIDRQKNLIECIVHDLTFKNLAEIDHARLLTAIEQAVEAIVISTKQSTVLYVNSAFVAITGYQASDILGQPLTMLGYGEIDKQSLEDNINKIVRGEIWRVRKSYKKKDGTRFECDMTISPIKNDSGEIISYVTIMRDVTHETALETQLRQTQNLRAIGQLASGIAHEINTPMQFLSDNTHFLSESFSDLMRLMQKYNELVFASRQGAPTGELIQAIDAITLDIDLGYLCEEIPGALQQSQNGIQRVSEIVRAMKEFSHPDVKEKVLLDINRAINTTITIARNEWKYASEVETDFDPKLPFIPCYPGEFNQAVLNLISNAAYAITDVIGDHPKVKGKIKVSTRKVDTWVEIRISDTGSGIPEAIRDRIFEPFFTTKKIGKGTGQGLTIAHNVIVEKLGGSITYETEVGKGTTFIMQLPIENNGNGRSIK